MIRDRLPQFMAFHDGKLVGIGILPVVMRALAKARDDAQPDTPPHARKEPRA